MLKENWRFIARVQRLGDLSIMVLAFFAAYYGRAALFFWDEALGWGLPFEGPYLAPLKDYFIVLVVALLSGTIFLNMMGAYNSMRLRSSWQLLWLFIVCGSFVFLSLAGVLFVLKIDLSRSLIVLFCILMVLGLAAERYIVLEFLRYWRRQGYNFRSIVVCGLSEQALLIAREIAAKPELGITIRCFANLQDPGVVSEDDIDLWKQKLRAVGCMQVGKIVQGSTALKKALEEYAIDEVIFTDIPSVMLQVEELILVCAEQGVRTTIAADLFSIGLVKSGLSYFAGMPLIHFQTPPGDRWELSLKRALDIVIASILLVLCAPLFLIIALGVRIGSSGPVFFVQKRVGLNGRLFDCYKFRSMYIDAEKQLDNLQSHNEMEGPAFKMKDDPRITRVGRWLRRFSLDELPQLWNVLKGDMSLVGPRPPVPGEVSVYARRYRRRLSMRPGITCIWQVSGRNNIKDFDTWVQLDLEYIDNWSIGKDLALLMRTIPAVLFGLGAR